MSIPVVSVTAVKDTTGQSVFQFNNTTKELNLGGEFDYVTGEWITKECDVEGDLSSLKNMT